MSRVTTVSVVDDDAAVRHALKQQVLRMKNHRFMTEHAEAVVALQLLPLSPPDILLLDVRMPGMDGLECLHRIRGKLPATRIIIFTGYGTDDVFRQALKGRADGFVQKGKSWTHLVQAMSLTTTGRLFAPGPWGGGSPALRAGNLTVPTLSDRELQILKLLARDLANKEIADRLGITRQAVANRLWMLYGKLGVHRASGAIARALTWGLISSRDCEDE